MSCSWWWIPIHSGPLLETNCPYPYFPSPPLTPTHPLGSALYYNDDVNNFGPEQSCPRCTVPTTLSWLLFSSVCPVTAALSSLSCSGRAVLSFLSWLNYLRLFTPAVLSDCPFQTVLSRIICPSFPIPAVLSIFLVQLSCPCIPIPSSFVTSVLSLLSCSDRPVLSRPPYIRCPAFCLVLAVQGYPCWIGQKLNDKCVQSAKNGLR